MLKSCGATTAPAHCTIYYYKYNNYYVIIIIIIIIIIFIKDQARQVLLLQFLYFQQSKDSNVFIIGDKYWQQTWN